MAGRIIRDGRDLEGWVTFLRAQKLPMTVSKVAGAKRSIPQNRTIHMWFAEVAAHRGDTTSEEVRAECKLIFGVPILRRDDPVWCAEYDAMLKPLPYAAKVRLIQFTDLPVTSRMTVRQGAEFMDLMQRAYAEQGITLTDPEAAKYAGEHA